MRKNKNSKNKYILYLNSSKDKELDVFLISGNKIIDKIIQAGDYKVSEYLLKLIEQILRNNKIKLTDLKAIMTITGPGPFTSLRIAVAAANTLAYGLEIPVVGITNKQGLTNNEKLVKLGLSKLSTAKVGKYISPFYNRPPNITISK